jgi:hypothetical protein
MCTQSPPDLRNISLQSTAIQVTSIHYTTI